MSYSREIPEFPLPVWRAWPHQLNDVDSLRPLAEKSTCHFSAFVLTTNRFNSPVLNLESFYCTGPFMTATSVPDTQQ